MQRWWVSCVAYFCKSLVAFACEFQNLNLEVGLGVETLASLVRLFLNIAEIENADLFLHQRPTTPNTDLHWQYEYNTSEQGSQVLYVGNPRFIPITALSTLTKWMLERVAWKEILAEQSEVGSCEN